MINALILMILLFISGPTHAAPKNNPIYEHIIRLNKKINKEYAMQLSNQIHTLSKQYKVNPQLVVAIMMQESGLDPHNHRTALGLDSYGNLIQVVTDVGLMQVNTGSIKAYNLNAFMLMTDPSYQIWAGIKILADKVKQCSKSYPGTAYACFHSATPSRHAEYVAAVSRWL